MLFSRTAELQDAQYILRSLGRSQAIIEFQLDGTIINANQNFLALMGYSLPEIQGKHHSIFVERSYAENADYQEFWAQLNRGEFSQSQFKRLAKDGSEVWIEASYNPVRDAVGKVYKVVKVATDITRKMRDYSELKGKVDAIGKSQGVIEFNLDGTVITANENFLSLIDYRLDEIKGQHHSMFVEPEYASSEDYRAFWATLNRGEFVSRQFKRRAKGGREIWIEASYNPIFDVNGTPYKVVKFATDITKQVTLLKDLKQMIDVNFSEIETAVDRSNQRTDNAGHAAGTTSRNVQSVAAAAEQLASSVMEISESMSKSSAASDEAHALAMDANQSTARLNDAAQSMGGIVGLIQKIASQINMLALNATIESARAGEAGKGFAVVANEVKGLAKQVADATHQISKEIEGIQSVAGDVSRSLGTIGKSIENVREYVTATAGAVEEQSAVTAEMSSNMQTASTSVGEISVDVSEIAAAINQVAAAVSKTKDAAQILVR